MKLPRQEAAMSSCDDGMVHAFAVLDDGTSRTPLCGKTVGPSRSSGDSRDLFCEACIEPLCEELGISHADFMVDLKG